MKKLLSILLALSLVFSFSLYAFADYQDEELNSEFGKMVLTDNKCYSFLHIGSGDELIISKYTAVYLLDAESNINGKIQIEGTLFGMLNNIQLADDYIFSLGDNGYLDLYFVSSDDADIFADRLQNDGISYSKDGNHITAGDISHHRHFTDCGICLICGEYIDENCSHIFQNGNCIYCGLKCDHSWGNGKCTVCGLECNHSWGNGKCTVCNMECNHSWENGKCTVCGLECNHSWGNGVCTICGIKCDNDFHNGVCPECGMEIDTSVSVTGSTLSDGNITIIVGIACAAVFGIGGYILGNKNKKTFAADAAPSDTSDDE